ncbi:hypothetical protein VC83_08918 [Pseudogymnoascus destructans]|uniref:Zinc finger PHD-type domain-containing protein n=1 Tax=Pseudogymnoascus destructans TaxID=655981 RepID=A0A176ZY23_9PEZI|nr:uncharacterized protein VC83_08918 [Pseudogymnoascus destructans]OAF54806.1 hypothetical protein VC83_08918 [Pseudogymnoascus destructans]
MPESVGLAPGGVEEPIALSVPPLSGPQQLPESTAGEVPKDGVWLSIVAAGDNGPSDTSPQQATTIDASHTAPSVTLPPTPTPLQPIPPTTAAAPSPSTPLQHLPPASNPTASPSTSPSSTDTQTLTSSRAALEATILSTGTAYTHPIEARARDLHAMNIALATQQTRLLSVTGALAKENDRLAKLADEGRRRLKEAGALDVWAEVLEGDLAAVEECLRIVEGGREERCESCGGDLAAVDEDAVRWCEGCDGLWHAGCCGEEGVGVDAAGEGEGVADRDGGVEWRCRECALREDLEAMVGELGGFVDDEMDTSGEITVELPKGGVVHDGRWDLVHDEGGEAVMEEARNWKGKGVVYHHEKDVKMAEEGVAGGEEVGAIAGAVDGGSAAGGADVLEKPGVHADTPSDSKQADPIQDHESTSAPSSGDQPLEMDLSELEVAPPRRAVWTWGV